MSILLKGFFVVECNKCGVQLSGVDDCGFTVYDSVANARDAMQEAGWIGEDPENITCDDCQRSQK